MRSYYSCVVKFALHIKKRRSFGLLAISHASFQNSGPLPIFVDIWTRILSVIAAFLPQQGVSNGRDLLRNKHTGRTLNNIDGIY